MKLDIRNHSSMTGIEKVAEELYKFAQKQLGFEQPARVVFESQGDRVVDIFSPTGNYNPQTRTIKIFVDHRHPKDILRSMAHELIHHSQCCQGAFDGQVNTSPGYAQNDDRMRELEKDAYFWGNGILFRDWEDNHKQKRSWNLMNENKEQFNEEQKLRQKVRSILAQRLQETAPLNEEQKLRQKVRRILAQRLQEAATYTPPPTTTTPTPPTTTLPAAAAAATAGGTPTPPPAATPPPTTTTTPPASKRDDKKELEEQSMKFALKNGRLVELEKAMDERKGPKHNCADHVKENRTGREGRPINHTLLEDGSVTHYTVEFQNEIVENIPVEYLTEIKGLTHEHAMQREDYDHDESKPRKPFEEGEELEEEKPLKEEEETYRDLTSPRGMKQHAAFTQTPEYADLAKSAGRSPEGIEIDRDTAAARVRRAPAQGIEQTGQATSQGRRLQAMASLEEEKPLKEWYNDTLHEALLKKFKIKK